MFPTLFSLTAGYALDANMAIEMGVLRASAFYREAGGQLEYVAHARRSISAI